MNTSISIAVIGGTGKSGKYLVKRLLELGYNLKLLLRDPNRFEGSPAQVEIIQGDARNESDILSCLEGCQAVISTLGQPVGETSIFSDATRNILQAMKTHQIQRYIVITGLNVDTPSDHKSPQTRFSTDWMKTNYPKITLDKQVEYEVLSQSEVRWTLVRLPMIEQTDRSGEISISLEDCPGPRVSATDLADFLISQLDDTQYECMAPFIASVD